MLNVNTKKKIFNACNDELLLHSNSEGQDQPVHPHSLTWIFSGLFLSIHIFCSIHYYTPGMPKGYIVFVGFVRPSVRLSVLPSVLLSVHQSVIPSVNTCYNQVLLRSFFDYVYICSHLSETVHIWYGGGGTWEGSLPFYIYGPLGHASIK